MAENEFKVPEEFQNLTLLQLKELGIGDEDGRLKADYQSLVVCRCHHQMSRMSRDRNRYLSV